jgi:hypothetical protein
MNYKSILILILFISLQSCGDSKMEKRSFEIRVGKFIDIEFDPTNYTVVLAEDSAIFHKGDTIYYLTGTINRRQYVDRDNFEIYTTVKATNGIVNYLYENDLDREGSEIEYIFQNKRWDNYEDNKIRPYVSAWCLSAGGDRFDVVIEDSRRIRNKKEGDTYFYAQFGKPDGLYVVKPNENEYIGESKYTDSVYYVDGIKSGVFKRSSSGKYHHQRIAVFENQNVVADFKENEKLIDGYYHLLEDNKSVTVRWDRKSKRLEKISVYKVNEGSQNEKLYGIENNYGKYTTETQDGFSDGIIHNDVTRKYSIYPEGIFQLNASPKTRSYHDLMKEAGIN